MLQKTRLIVLHSLKYGDSGLILHAYSDLHGRQSFLIQGVRKKTSKISSYWFQPLSLLNAEVYVKKKRDLQRIKEVKPSLVMETLHFDIRKSAVALFISELLYRTLQEIEPNAALFDYLFNAIQLLDKSDKGFENFHILFMIQYSKFVGIYPLDHSELHRYTTTSGYEISDLLNYSLNDMTRLVLDGKTRTALLKSLVAYYNDHLEGMGNIKSLPVLFELFH